MFHRPKMFGAVAIALCAIGLVSASAAPAAEFHSEEKNLTLSGSQTTTNILTTDGGEVTCAQATFSGTTSTTSTTSSTFEVLPKLSECHINIFGVPSSATVDIQGCLFKFHIFGGTFAFGCLGAIFIEVTASGCTIKVGSQEGLSSTTYTEEGSGSSRSIITDFNITGIAYEEVNKGLFPTCASPGKKTTNGTYTGSVTISAKNGGGVQKGIWVA